MKKIIVFIAILSLGCSSVKYYTSWVYSSAYKGRDQQYEGLCVGKSMKHCKEIPIYNIHEDEWLKKWNPNVWFYYGDRIKYDISLKKVLAVKHIGGKWINVYYSYQKQ